MSTPSTQSLFPRGSEWRKWDLQIHTPFSELNNGFGSDFEAYAKQLLTLAVQKEIAVVGITDYFCIEGYKQLRAILDDPAALTKLVGAEIAEKVGSVLFLPNIELRTTILYEDKEGKQSRVNFHVIFSDALKVSEIEEHFLRELKFTAESNPDSPDERWSCMPANLEILGQKLQAQHQKFRNESVMFTGMKNAVVHHEDVTTALQNRASLFKDKYAFCLPCDEDLSNFNWDGQGHHMRKGMYHKSHLLLSPNPRTRDFALGRMHATLEDYVEEFKGCKPCFHSSDAHTYTEIFNPDKGRHTWIKADPTFRGLRQTLNEPEDRVFIGEIPSSLERVAKRPTRVITELEVKKVDNAPLREAWFNSSLPLNPELVAIIGNKGAGKSALSDIIGLLGNTPRYDSFSFLHPNKFRDSRSNKARHFKARLTWADSTHSTSKSLELNPAEDSVEKVKYIPQSYLEEICNEIGQGKGSKFYSELEQVIFSHVPQADKIGFATLSDLLKERNEEVEVAISFLVEEVSDVNGRVIACEERLSPRHKAVLDSQLVEKNRELDAHDKNRPKDRPKPEEDPAVQLQTKGVAEALEVAKVELAQVEKEVAELRERDAVLAKRKMSAEKLLAKVENFQAQTTTFLADTKKDCSDLGLKQENLVSVTIDTAPVVALILDLGNQRKTIAVALNPLTEGGQEHTRVQVANRMAILQTKLSTPQREYQAYLNSLKEWDDTRKLIVGDATVTGSIRHIQAQLEALKLVPAELAKLKKERLKQTLGIYAQKSKLRKYYSAYYGEVQRFLAAHPLAAGGQFGLTFDVTIAQSGFAGAFLGKINRRKIGPFMGEEEGAAVLKKLLDSTSFDSACGTLRYVRRLLKVLNGGDDQHLEPKDQLKGSTTLQDLYDYIFSLEYLSPIYNLKWDGKTLEQLSPGERGNLLLIFYLLVDQDDLPLVIDQPEENLDNQTVFKTLVPCIKDAKKRRQIIIVTHNPNLAVVCDAEQIICADIRKEENNEVKYLTGAIENTAINQKIVDILEGTRPAFDKRDDKYHP